VTNEQQAKIIANAFCWRGSDEFDELDKMAFDALKDAEARGALKRKCVLCHKHEAVHCTECYHPDSVTEMELK